MCGQKEQGKAQFPDGIFPEKGGGVPAAGQCERWATSVSPCVIVSQCLICTVHSEPHSFLKRGTSGKVTRVTSSSVSLVAGDFPEHQAVGSVSWNHLPLRKPNMIATQHLTSHMGQMWPFDPQVAGRGQGEPLAA